MAPKNPKSEAIVVLPVKEEISPRDVSIEAMLMQAIDKGVPVETMERLMAMRRELKAEYAKEQFTMAMAKFQSDCPTIKKTKEVKTNGGAHAYSYAPLESIIEQVRNALTDNGFSYSTGMVLLDTSVKVTVTATHIAGHSEDSEMEVRLGNKTQMMSDSQVIAAAQTFAKRYAFCNAFGILTGNEDTDARPQPEAPRATPTKPYVAKVYTQAREVTAPEADPTEAQKHTMAIQLKKLGHSMEGMTKAKADQLVKVHSGLEALPENFEEIIVRLDFLIKEREANEGSALADEFITYDEPEEKT